MGPGGERQSADLPPASRPGGRDDPRRSSQGRRSAALGAQCRGRISGQSAHGSQGLSATGGRRAGREPTGPRNVHQCRRTQGVAAGRRAEVRWGRMSQAPPPASTRPSVWLACHRRKFWRLAQISGRDRKPKGRSAAAMVCIETRGLRKAFGKTIALDGVNLRVEEGRILGLVGPNGAGKTTALNAIVGLTSYQGELRVLGRDPWTERDQLMRDVSFIADVAVLPRWIRVSQALDYLAGMHPRFDRAKAEGFLAKTNI